MVYSTLISLWYTALSFLSIDILLVSFNCMYMYALLRHVTEWTIDITNVMSMELPTPHMQCLAITCLGLYVCDYAPTRLLLTICENR